MSRIVFVLVLLHQVAVQTAVVPAARTPGHAESQEESAGKKHAAGDGFGGMWYSALSLWPSIKSLWVQKYCVGRENGQAKVVVSEMPGAGMSPSAPSPCRQTESKVAQPVVSHVPSAQKLQVMAPFALPGDHVLNDEGDTLTKGSHRTPCRTPCRRPVQRTPESPLAVWEVEKQFPLAWSTLVRGDVGIATYKGRNFSSRSYDFRGLLFEQTLRRNGAIE